MSGSGPATQEQSVPANGAQQGTDPRRDFVSRVLGDTEDGWGRIFQSAGQRYTPPRLVLFRDATQSACGVARTAVGPFYCPGDREVYLDTAFFDELRSRFGASGDFAEGYVIAHEVGHHVQNLMGTMQQFDARAGSLDARSRNALSVRLELQADCYAGVWGASARKRGLIDASDVEAGINAAQAVGDDRIMRRTQGVVVPDAFTHGSSAQRVRWFKKGLESGEIAQCDTFNTNSL
jgi:predicted metalloprotease